MTRLTKFTAGLMGATALAALSAPAYAVGTAANTSVENTFTLTYDTGTATNTITNNCDPNTTTCAPGTEPTTFVVDRVVNLTVTGSTSDDNAPGDTNVPVLFTVANLGNDTQSYTLQTEVDSNTPFPLTNGTTGIEFVVLPTGSTCDATPPSGLATYDESSPATGIPVVPADEVLCVYVYQDIDNTAVDGESNTIDLLATTTSVTNGVGSTTPLSYGDPNDPATVQSVAIETGLNTFTGDVDEDGRASAPSVYNVGAANVTALKTVALVSQDGSGCGGFTQAATTSTTELHIPGACVEYTIAVTNEGSGEATDIDLTDILPIELDYQTAEVVAAGWDVQPTLQAPSTGACNGGGTGCDIIAALDGELPGVPAGGSVTGTVRIRALVK